MRVLRRAKEILAGEDVTYERARRDLASENLLSYAPDAESEGTAARDAAAEREAAERFVRDVVERATAPLREANTQLVARLSEVEREVRTLRDILQSADGALDRDEALAGERRRGWPFSR